MKMRRTLVILFFFILLSQALTSEQNVSQMLEQRLISDGFAVQKQFLSSSLSEEFPYNIAISLPSTLEYPIHRFFIIISQEQAFNNYTDILLFIAKMQETPASFPLEIVFCTNNSSPHPALKNTLSGISTFTQYLDSVSYTSAIELQFLPENEENREVIEIGTKGILSPPELIQPLLTNLDTSGVEYTIRGRVNSFYRLGFVSVSPVLTYLLQTEIPAAALYIRPSSTEKTAQALSAFVQSSPPNVTDWDNNYTLIQILGKRFIISEYILMVVIIAISGISLFFLCSFSFLTGKTTFIRKEELSRTWYLLPIIIGITSLFLYLAQHMTIAIFPSWQYNTVTALIIKLAFGLVFLSLVSLAQYLFSFPLTSFIYGYLLLIVVFINVFIFTTADLSLFIPFSIEYLIVYTSRSIKRKRGIFLAALFMTLPFLPYIIFIDAETRTNLIRAAFDSSVMGNVFFACFAVPFEIMWIRIMVRMKLFGKQKGVSLKQILIELGGTALAIVFISLSVSIVRAKTTSEYKTIEQKNTIQTSPLSYISAGVERSVLFNRASAIVTLSSSIPVVRYNIHIESDAPLPIYDANYPYDSLSVEGSAIFELDDYPPNPLKLRFSSSADYDAKLVITSYILYGSTIIEEKKSILLEKEQ